MKFKTKLMAAAVALAAASGANAAMDNFASGNGSLAFIALDSTGSPISMMMDLNYNVDSFLSNAALTSTAGNKIEWNFSTNTLKVNNVVQAAAQTNWSGAYSTFASLAQSTETKWGVIAGDSISTSGSTTPIRYLSTSTSPLATIQNQSKSNLSFFNQTDALYNANNLLQAASNGSTAQSGAAYVGNGGSFNIAGTWQTKTTASWSAYALEGGTQSFYDLEGVNGISATKALVNPYAGQFTYAAGVLTYEVAPIPEPSEYALMLAGLGMLGFMARRRLNNRA